MKFLWKMLQSHMTKTKELTGKGNHYKGGHDLYRQIPQQREDSHSDELTLHFVGDAWVRGKQANTQCAAKLICDGGQAEVVAQVDAGTKEGDESQAATQQVVK